MRGFITACLLLASPAVSGAQTCQPGVLMTGLGSVLVTVTLQAGERLRGTLICLDRDVVVLESGARVRTVPLSDVARIVKPRDRLWNGFAIGAGIGLLLAAPSYGEAEIGGASAGPYLLQVVAVFGGLGAIVDWLHGSSLTIYARGPHYDSGPQSSRGATAVSWHVRF